MSIKFEGFDELDKKLLKLIDDKTMNEALTKAALEVEGTAKQKAPKGDTGALRNSITSKVQDKEAIIFTPLEYAPYVEYGTGLFAEEGGRTDVPWFYKDERGNWHATSGMPPHPYMRPALQESREKILEIFKGAIKQND